MVNAVDLKNKQFGRLTAIEATDKRLDNKVVWKCSCKCGNIVYVKSTSLTKGEKKSCGCLKDKSDEIRGKTFGFLTALEISDKRINGYFAWKCSCKCGNIVTVRVDKLLKGTKTDCGCVVKSNLPDLTGKTFGKLTALELVRHETTGLAVWKCQCSCGNIVYFNRKKLTSGQKISCGCHKEELKDITGKTYNKLTALEPTNEIKHGCRLWKCRCQCGNIAYASKLYLEKGLVKSCGCLKIKTEEIKGKIFGNLTAIEPTKERKDGCVIWKCICSCGNFAYVKSIDLLNGKAISCGCILVKKKTRMVDLTGQTFNRLTVICDSKKRTSYSGDVIWKCKCECGNIVYVRSNLLRTGKAGSCGCFKRDLFKVNSRKYMEKNCVENTNLNTISIKKPNKNNKIGIRGVIYEDKKNTYLAYIRFQKKTYRLGSFSTKEEAKQVRKEAEEHIFGTFLEWYYSRQKEEIKTEV